MPGKIKLLFTALCFFSAVFAKAQPWTRITGLPVKSYWTLEVIGNTMYAGATDTLYISKDKGVTWAAKKVPGTGFSINAVTVYSSRLYAGTDDGSYMSSDGGSTWVPSNIHVHITSFAQWKGNLYASTAGGGIFVCNQVSNTWTPFNPGYPVSVAGNVVRLINTGHTLFAAGGSDGAGYRLDTTTTQWKEIFYTGAAVPGMTAYDLMQAAEGGLFVLNNTTKMMRSSDTGSTWIVDSTDMRSGISGVMARGVLQDYVALNDGTGTWIQSRPAGAPAGTSWATGEEQLSAGTVYSMREYDRRLFLAKNDGVYFKANGSPSAGISGRNALQSARIFPNPSQGALTVDAKGLDKLEVWDLAGRLVHEVKKPASGYEFRLPAAGTYIVRLYAGAEAISRRVVVR